MQDCKEALSRLKSFTEEKRRFESLVWKQETLLKMEPWE